MRRRRETGIVIRSLHRLAPWQRTHCARLGLAATLLVPLALAVPWAAAQESSTVDEMRSVQDGVYTARQATRGAKVFDQVCSQCHNGHDFVIDGYMEFWSDATAFEFVDFISSTMPEDNPGGLRPDDYIDVITYIFGLNGIPAGETELGSDVGVLSQIRIEGPYGATTGS